MFIYLPPPLTLSLLNMEGKDFNIDLSAQAKCQLNWGIKETEMIEGWVNEVVKVSIIHPFKPCQRGEE